MSNIEYYATVDGSNISLDQIFTLKNGGSNNNIVTGFKYDGSDIGERYYKKIPASGLDLKYDIRGQYKYIDSNQKNEIDFVDIFSQYYVYNFSVSSANGEESNNNTIGNINVRKGLGVTFTFTVISNNELQFQIGEVDGGFKSITSLYEIGTGLVHQNGGGGGNGVVIYMKDTLNNIRLLCCVGGGGGAGGFNKSYNYAGQESFGYNHHLFGMGGNAGTTINFTNENFNFYYGNDGGLGLTNNGVSFGRSGGAGGTHVEPSYINGVDKYKGENGDTGDSNNAWRFGGGGGGGGFYRGSTGIKAGSDVKHSDSASGGGAGGSKMLKTNSNLLTGLDINVHNINVTQNSDSTINDIISVKVNGQNINNQNIYDIEDTNLNSSKNIYSNFKHINDYF